MRYAVAILATILFAACLHGFHWIVLSLLNAAIGQDVRTLPPDTMVKLPRRMEAAWALDDLLYGNWPLLVALVFLLCLTTAWALPSRKATSQPASPTEQTPGKQS
jgi:hypothetical protein